MFIKDQSINQSDKEIKKSLLKRAFSYSYGYVKPVTNLEQLLHDCDDNWFAKAT